MATDVLDQKLQEIEKQIEAARLDRSEIEASDRELREIDERMAAIRSALEDLRQREEISDRGVAILGRWMSSLFGQPRV